MTRARDIANLVDANGDIVAGALDNVPAADVVNDTTPQLGGNLESNGNDVVFADSDKAIFGAGNDLEIYHNGSNSLIQDAGTGNLQLIANNIDVLSSTFENVAKFNENADVKLYYDNAEKLATTSTGVDVTGNVTVDAEGGSATVDVRQGSAKQWARVDQNNTPQVIEDSYNVTSITDDGNGQTRFNFVSNMNNALYSNLGIAGSANRFCIADSPTTSGSKINVYAVSSQTANDSTHVFNTVHGDLA